MHASAQGWRCFRFCFCSVFAFAWFVWLPFFRLCVCFSFCFCFVLALCLLCFCVCFGFCVFSLLLLLLLSLVCVFFFLSRVSRLCVSAFPVAPGIIFTCVWTESHSKRTIWMKASAIIQLLRPPCLTRVACVICKISNIACNISQ